MIIIEFQWVLLTSVFLGKAFGNKRFILEQLSLSGCYRFVGNGFGLIWSKLGYAAIRFGALRMLASQVWSSSKWFYLVNCIPLLNVVSLDLEVEKQQVF